MGMTFKKKKLKKPGALVYAGALFLWCVVKNLSTTKAVSNQYLEAKEINTTKHATLEKFSSIVALELTIL